MGNEQTREHVNQKENGRNFATAVDFSNLSPEMITDAQSRAARALLNRTTAPLAETSGPSEMAVRFAEPAHGAQGMQANNLVRLQRAVETTAMVSIDGDVAIGAEDRLRKP